MARLLALGMQFFSAFAGMTMQAQETVLRPFKKISPTVQFRQFRLISKRFRFHEPNASFWLK